MKTTNRNMSLTIGGIVLLVLIVCCFCLFMVGVSDYLSATPTPTTTPTATQTKIPTKTSTPIPKATEALKFTTTLSATIAPTTTPSRIPTLTIQPTATRQPTLTSVPYVAPLPGSGSGSGSVAPPSGGNCDPHYVGVCIPPPPPDLDCSQISYRRFKVVGGDPHNFDADKDGIGCEN